MPACRTRCSSDRTPRCSSVTPRTASTRSTRRSPRPPRSRPLMTVDRLLPSQDADDLIALTRDIADKVLDPIVDAHEKAETYPEGVFAQLGSAGLLSLPQPERSEERRVGKEGRARGAGATQIKDGARAQA